MLSYFAGLSACSPVCFQELSFSEVSSFSQEVNLKQKAGRPPAVPSALQDFCSPEATLSCIPSEEHGLPLAVDPAASTDRVGSSCILEYRGSVI